MKQILYNKSNFTTTQFYGPNIIVISENEWLNKNGLVKERGDGVIIRKKNIALFHVLDHLRHFFHLAK